MELLTFFSSDSRFLYKADVFRVLALPLNYTIQFRYSEELVDKEVAKLVTNEGIRGREGMVVFVNGNHPTDRVETSNLGFTPLRIVTVKDAEYYEELRYFVFVLEVNRFATAPDVTLRAGAVNKMPPDCFVRTAQEMQINFSNWHDRAKALENHFTGSPFYSFRVLKVPSILWTCACRFHEVRPDYIRHWRISEYRLREESEYILEVRYYDPHGHGKSPLFIKSDADELNIENPFENGCGADVDIRNLAVSTASLESNSAPAFVRFSPTGSAAVSASGGSASLRAENQNLNAETPVLAREKPKSLADIWEVRMRWKLVRKQSKTWTMGALGAMGVLAIVFGQLSLKFAVKADGNWDHKGRAAFWAVLALLFAATSTAQLFRIFNKK